MPSKSSKKKATRATRSSPRKRAPISSKLLESELGDWAERFARGLKPGDRILLEGPMGAGKSTLARALLKALGAIRGEGAGAGSPTFALAHEYPGGSWGEVAHADLYRLNSEEEIRESGLESLLWERATTVIAEWMSKFPSTLEMLVERPEGRSVWQVTLGFVEGRPDLRNVESRRLV
ncbi:MAG: tRNA (adenosine(37)-N6)-threonylcarbamoyltransferase complex ATPase subunit type 1 TsaE [Bdellovibrionales bacterium]|nr:tRNA (adenosine(37)-N6)-threonylcarbamoyltransferase complex ATPase subunit type 1 TsaE [Bdellovibrionales bacterium]